MNYIIQFFANETSEEKSSSSEEFSIIPSSFPMLRAINQKNEDAVKAIIAKNGPDGFDRGMPYLMASIIEESSSGTTHFLKMLLRHGANANIVDRRGTSALGMATDLGTEEQVMILLAAGANPNLRMWNRQTPYTNALNRGDPKIIALIEKHPLFQEVQKKRIRLVDLHTTQYNWCGGGFEGWEGCIFMDFSDEKYDQNSVPNVITCIHVCWRTASVNKCIINVRPLIET